MTETFYQTGSYKIDHTTYGGEITLFDFDGHPTMGTVAKKIMSDEAFDKRCRKNCEQRNFIKNNQRRTEQ